MKRIRVFALGLGAAFVSMAMAANAALAVYVPQDYTPAETGIVAELQAALAKFWIPLVIIIAVPLGIKLFRRLVH